MSAEHSVRALGDADPPRGARLHLDAHPGARCRLFAVRPERRRLAVLDYAGLPALGEGHPDDPGLACHALLPRRTPQGWEVAAVYWREGA